MTSLFGYIHKKNSKKNNSDISLMQANAYNEDFYNSGVYNDEDTRVCIGWSCLRNSFTDCLPIFNENKKLILFYLGENHLDIDKINLLKGKNHQFNKKNASYIVHMYEEYGEYFINHLNGQYVGIIIDKIINMIIIFNDRYSFLNLYYYENEEIFYFSTESKVLINSIPSLNKLNYSAITEFLTKGRLSENCSFITNINRLKPANKITFKEPDYFPIFNTYFNFDEVVNQYYLDEKYLFEKLLVEFPKILEKYFFSDRILGIRINPEINSLIIPSLINYGPRKVKYFTFSKNSNIDKKLSKLFGQRYVQLPEDDELKLKLSENISDAIALSEGYAGIESVVELSISKIMRQVSDIQVSDYFSDAFFQPIPAKRFENDELISTNALPIEDSIKDIKIENSHCPDYRIDYLQKGRYSEKSRLYINKSQLSIRSPFADNDLIKMMFKFNETDLRKSQFGTKIVLNRIIQRKKYDNIIPINHLILFKKFLPKHTYYNMINAKLSRFVSERFANDIYLDMKNDIDDFTVNILTEKKSINRPFVNKTKLINYINNCNNSYFIKILHRMSSIELFLRNYNL